MCPRPFVNNVGNWCPRLCVVNWCARSINVLCDDVYLDWLMCCTMCAMLGKMKLTKERSENGHKDKKNISLGLLYIIRKQNMINSRRSSGRISWHATNNIYIIC
eukprot:404025_1